MNCIFCKIIAGELPAYVVYEDELFMAIMNLFPTTPGSVLVIPKRHAADIYGLTEEEAHALMPLAQKISRKIHEELKPAGLNLLQNNGEAAGQEIFHFHLHIIPRYDGDNARRGLPKHSPTSPSPEELEEMARRLKI